MKRIKFIGSLIITCTIITFSTVVSFANSEGPQPGGGTDVGVWSMPLNPCEGTQSSGDTDTEDWTIQLPETP